MEGPAQIILGLVVHLARLCCPHQPVFASIPVVEYDISEGLHGYRTMMHIRKLREQALSPFVIGYHHNIPVTPLPNPHTRMSSHHIIRLVNGVQGPYRVDLLIRDTDLYFLAFRREMEGEWGRWHRFKAANVPDFLDARDMGIKFSYGEREDVRPGGPAALEHIYYTFGGFADDGVAGADIKRAAYCATAMFCESSRLYSVFKEVSRRIRNGSPPDALQEGLWHKIKKWTHLGTVALRYRVQGLLQPHVDLPDWCLQDHGLETVDNLVGASGEVMIVKINTTWLGLTPAELQVLLDQNGVGDGEDPGFEEN